MFDLTGKTALITGASGGIGGAVAAALHAAGASVALSGTREAPLRELAESLGERAHVVTANLGDAAAVEALPKQAAEAMGSVDILVNNAGITRDKLAAKLDPADWKAVLDTNLGGAFYVSQAAIPHMVERGSGRIIMISSLNGEIGNIGQSNYSASKAGMIGLTKTLAKEVAFSMGKAGKLTDDSLGVTVNCITPGYVLTEMVAAMPDKVLDNLKSVIPVRRLARPEEVARIVTFLAADESSFITGQTWAVNGGQNMA